MKLSQSTLIACISVASTTIPTQAQNIEYLGTVINSPYNELAPVISPDGKTLFFARVSHPLNKNGDKGSQDIWFSESVSTYWAEARRMTQVVNREDYNSCYSISPDGNALLVKGAYDNGEYLTRGFSVCRKRPDGGWGVPNKLDIPDYAKLSKGLYDCGFLSADGKTLLMSFSEKKKGTIDDLYVSFLDKDGTWSEPMYLGDDINTDDFTETTPFLAPDGVTLYFSSDRPGGLGKNDIWVSKRLDKTWERWSKPVNLGEPINSPDYDAYYSVSAVGDYAYFITYRGVQGKGDVARIKLNQKPIEPNTTIAMSNGDSDKNKTGNNGKGGDTNTNKEPLTKSNPTQSDPVVLLSGKLFDNKTGKVPANAKIIYESLPDGAELGVATPDPITGIYKIVLPYGKKYGITAVIDGYVSKSQNIDLSQMAGGKYQEITGRDIPVEEVKEGAVIALNNIFFEFGKANLQPDSYPELNRLAQLLTERPKMTIEIAGHTDDIGSDEANLKLSQDRAESVKIYLVSQKIAPVRLTAKGYGESRPVILNDSDEHRQQNRRVEFVILKK
jgi:OmpA-OmpF porin, OOP family